MKKELKLVPFAIPAGWRVQTNHFYMIDIDEMEDNDWYPFVEDILYMDSKSYRLSIDLGWYSEGDKNGTFILQLLPWGEPLDSYKLAKKSIIKKYNGEKLKYILEEDVKVLWTNPLLEIKSKSYKEIQDRLEKILIDIEKGKI